MFDSVCEKDPQHAVTATSLVLFQSSHNFNRILAENQILGFVEVKRPS